MIFVQPAYAYVDPGSGLLAVQILGAAVSGIGFYLRHKILRIFGRLRNPALGKDAESLAAGEVHAPANGVSKK